MENLHLELKNGTRQAGNSQRFSSFPFGNPLRGIYEPIDNLLTYGKSSGRLTITNNGNGTATYSFWNDADAENLPSLEKLTNILSIAGESISSGVGVSLKGEGIEAYAISARPRRNSTVVVKIKIVRNNKTYSGTLIINGKEQKVLYTCDKYEYQTDEPNSFFIVYENVQHLSKKDFLTFKDNIKCKLFYLKKKFKFEIVDDNGKEILNPVDMLYRKELKNTNSFYEKKYYFYNEKNEKEFLKIEASDIRNIAVEHSNEIDERFKSKRQPELCGVSIITEDGFTTVNRGKDSWLTIDNSYHSTKNAIRIDVSIGKSMFKWIHSESSIKREATSSFLTIVDSNNEPVIFYDINDNPISTDEIYKDINNFIKNHIVILKQNERTKINKNVTLEFKKEFNDEQIKKIISILNNCTSKGSTIAKELNNNLNNLTLFES